MRRHPTSASWTQRDFERETALFKKSLERHTTPDQLENKRRRKLHRWIGATAIVGVLCSGAYAMFQDNIEQNMEHASDGHVTVSYERPARHAADNDTAIMLVGGFDTGSSKPLVDSLGKVVQSEVDGEIWSVTDGRANLDFKEMVTEAEDLAVKRHVKQIVLAGESTGGPIQLAVNDLLVQDGQLQVPALFVNSSPGDMDTLQPDERQYMASYLQFINSHPGYQYSDYVRNSAEMAIRVQDYTKLQGMNGNVWNDLSVLGSNVPRFFDTLNDVQSSIKERWMPQSWMAYQQLEAINHADIDEHMASIAQHQGKSLKEVIVYLGNDPKGRHEVRDPLVDNVKASHEWCNDAKAHKLACYVLHTPHVIHGRPELSVSEYIATLKKAPWIRNEIETNRYQYEQYLQDLMRVRPRQPQ